MQLSRKILATLKQQGIVSGEAIFGLPEKVLQFGTGVLLRGLPDHFIDNANKQGLFNGRIVVVKSTDTGGTDAYAQQDGMYTLLERGVDHRERTERTVINASISRVLSAATEWSTILACAANPDMQIIISNTTEIGIVLLESDAQAQQPTSFPGRVLDFLETRYKAFNGSAEAGMVIVPAELIADNATKLKTIVLQLAVLKGLSTEFINWLNNENDFCNSLVDCIVPGKLSPAEQQMAEAELGYEDQLMIMTEPYRLWAIETNKQRTREILSFAKANKGVVLAPDINKFRELKLRLLNGTHTFSCGLAHLAGFTTVKEAMADQLFADYIADLMLNEIAPLVVSGEISREETEQFAAQVIDRFKNPFINHLWLNITAQYSSKMAMRIIPLLEKHYAQKSETPELMALGFAAFILFMRSTVDADGKYYGEWNGTRYRIQDDKASVLNEQWQKAGEKEIAGQVLKEKDIFGRDISQFPGFSEAVTRYLLLLIHEGATNALRAVTTQKSVA